MFGYLTFLGGGASPHTAWGGGTVKCEVFQQEIKKDLRGLDLQLTMEGLNGDTWDVYVFVEGSDVARLYNDNGGAGFDGDGIVLIDDVIVTGVQVNLTGAAAVAPQLNVNWRLRGLGGA